MKKLLHIIATPRGDASSTLKVSGAFLVAFRQKHQGWTVDELDLTKEEIPSMTVKRVDGKYALLNGKDLSGEMKESWNEIVSQIERFTSADVYLISVPMWNFSIPYTLKHYMDVIIQPRYLFRYTANGPEGLLKDKKMVVITSRGGDYSSAEGKKMDFQEPYLRSAFGFVGITDITFINAEQMAYGEELQKKSIIASQEKARTLATQI
ncbi:MAG TPA: ACP phosphodiesterase [Lentisphaeria bacterium]|nr:MAG: hypothetical protein A2X48_16405 [Lentisphaerae bacterium GWF2_49_21]HBC89339.1 ACP phosphodiesterase [Lentisphaeria bacterium]